MARSPATIVAALAFGITGILLPPAAHAVPIPAFALAWGSAGSDSAQFIELTGITVDRAGNVYAADYRNGTIQKFTPGGKCLAIWRLGGFPTLTPIGLAAADDGHVFATDFQGHRTLRCTSTGVIDLQKLWTNPATAFYPTDVAIESDGNLLVVDEGLPAVIRMTSSFGFLSQFGDSSAGADSLVSPFGVAVDDFGNVYVTDQGELSDGVSPDIGPRVVEFDPTGHFVRTWGARGSGPGEFGEAAYGHAIGPTGIAIAAGTLYVVDTEHDRIEMFDGQGNYLGEFGTSGFDDAQFNHPVNIAVGDGVLYVGDQKNYRIEKFSLNGQTPVAHATWGQIKTRFR